MAITAVQSVAGGRGWGTRELFEWLVARRVNASFHPLGNGCIDRRLLSHTQLNAEIGRSRAQSVPLLPWTARRESQGFLPACNIPSPCRSWFPPDCAPCGAKSRCPERGRQGGRLLRCCGAPMLTKR